MTHTALFETSLQQAHEWLRTVGGELGILDDRSDLAALRAGLHALRDSLPLSQAIELGDCLPVLVRGLYYEGWNPGDRKGSDILEHARRDLRGHQELMPTEKTLRACFNAVNHLLPQDKMSAFVNAFLPSIRDLWPGERKPPGQYHIPD